MDEQEVEAGDRVITKSSSFGHHNLGKIRTGVVAAILDNHHIGVIFDEEFHGGHDLSGAQPNFPVYPAKRGRWGQASELTFISHGEPPIPLAYSKMPGKPAGFPKRYPVEMQPILEVVDPTPEEEYQEEAD